MLLGVADTYTYSVTKSDAGAVSGGVKVSGGVGVPIAANFDPTYLGQAVAIPRNVNTLTAPQDSRAVSTNVAQTEEARLSIIDKIVNGAGRVLDAFGVEVVASGNGVSVYRSPTAGGAVLQTNPNANDWRHSPLLLIGGAALLGYVLLRK